MLYTIMDIETVFGVNADSPENASIGRKTEEIIFEGITVDALKNDDGTYKVERLISSNPKHFLDPRLAPGAVVSNFTKKQY